MSTDPETIAALRKELVEYRESLRHAHECYRGLERQQIVAAQRLAKLREAVTRRDALLERARYTLGVHTAHWDATGQSGAGCPVCIEQRELKYEILREIDKLSDRNLALDQPAPESTDGLPMLSRDDLRQRIELGILANGGETWFGRNCRCEPEVNNCPCEYCATWDALRIAKMLVTQPAPESNKCAEEKQ